MPPDRSAGPAATGRATRAPVPSRSSTTPRRRVATGGNRHAGLIGNGWYNRPVGVSLQRHRRALGRASVHFHHPLRHGRREPLDPRHVHGPRGERQQPGLAVGLSYDDTAPVVTGGTPARGTDVNGWYNHPVGVAVQWKRPDIGSRVVHVGHLLRTGRRERVPVGHLHGPSGQREQPARVRAQLRRHGARGLERGPRARRERGGLVQPPGLASTSRPPTRLPASPIARRSPTPAPTRPPRRSTRTAATGRGTPRGGASASSTTGPRPTRRGRTRDRQPNQAGWRNRAVVVDFEGTDGTSGHRGCTRRSYSGPDSGGTS